MRLGHARGKTILNCFLTLSRRFATIFGWDMRSGFKSCALEPLLTGLCIDMMHAVASYLCRGIEVVITGLTRNQFARNRTRVRIPPSAPKENTLYGCFSFGIVGGSRTLYAKREGVAARDEFSDIRTAFYIC